jgi:putative Holliday junction resolvase
LGRILAIDYGQKRVGLAVTDEDRIIASPLTTVHSKDIIVFLKDYMKRERVDLFVVGEPRQMNNQASESVKFIDPFVRLLAREFPEIPVERVDERFTSKMAQRSMLESGLKKKDRSDKSIVDMVSAAIILQSFLEMQSFNLNRKGSAE